MIVFFLLLGVAVLSKFIFYKDFLDLYRGNIIIWSIIILIQTICFVISYYIMSNYKQQAEKT